MEEKDTKAIAVELARLLTNEKAQAESSLSPEEIYKIRDIIGTDTQVKIDEIHSAFFKKRAGSDATLFEDLHQLVGLYKRASWLTRSLMWLIPAVALFLSSGDSILEWVRSLGGAK